MLSIDRLARLRRRAARTFSAIALAATMGFVSPTKADAALVTYQGIDYDVTALTGRFSDLQPTLIQQFWWGSQSTAVAFANLVGDDLGAPNVGSNFDFGPFFAFAPGGLITYGSVNGSAPAVVGPFGASNTTPYTYAVATASTVPEPTGMILVGLASAIAVARRRAVSKS